MSHRLLAIAALVTAIVGVALMAVTASNLEASPRMGIFLAVQAACTIVCLLVAAINWSLRN